MKRFRPFAAVLIISSLFPSPARSATLEQAHRIYFGGQPEQALQAYRSILNTHPSVEAALNAATVAQELGRHREAVAILEQARKSRLGGPGLLAQLAWAKLNQDDIPAAVSLFEQAAEREALEPMAALGRAYALLEAGRHAAAAEKLKALVAAQPKMGAAFFLLGRALEERKDNAGAVEAYESAIKVDSHFIEVRTRLASLFERMRRYDDAWRQYVRVSYVFGLHTALAGRERLASRITKKPSEIIPPRRIQTHTPVPPVIEAETLPLIRVGLGTGVAGDPGKKRLVNFRPSQGFTIFDVKNSTEVARGEARETWTIQLKPGGTADVVDGSGQTRASFSGAVRIRPDNRATGTTIINTLSFAVGTVWGGMADREYRGDVEVTIDKKAMRLVLVNVVSVEEYLYGVLAAEMPVGWPLEALKAQAVMARNVGVLRSSALRLHKKYGYDLCDDQHCQVYAGVGVESEKVRTAVDATRGRLLTFQGVLCHTVFSSNCGGMTQRGSQAGWGDVAYWNAVSDARAGERLPASPWEWKRWLQYSPDVYCEASQYVNHAEYRWMRIIPAEVIAEKLARRRKLGRVRQIYIVKRASSGRVQRVRVIGTKGEIFLSKEHEIRRYLGLGSLRSNMFFVDTSVRDGKANAFIFYGAGWGHGVGFCQSGAAGRAEDGASYEEILAAYFPGSVLR